MGRTVKTKTKKGRFGEGDSKDPALLSSSVAALPANRYKGEMLSK